MIQYNSISSLHLIKQHRETPALDMRAWRHNGFSLVELLVAMTLGLVLISGMIAVFAGNKRSSDLNSAMADIQENARFALRNMSRDIRMSGFQGCVDINRGAPMLLGNNLPTDDFLASASTASVISTGDLWSPTPPLGFNPVNHEAIADTHALTLQFGSSATFPLAQTVNIGGIPNRTGPIILDTTPGISTEEFNLSAGDYAIISNCTGADIFQATAVANANNRATVSHGATGNDNASLNFDFLAEPSTKFMRFQSNVYYVGDTGLENEDGDTITALYQQSLPYGNIVLNPPTELVRGVENMRVSFGIRQSEENVIYVQPGDALYDPSRVDSIRIGLLMTSYDRIAADDDQNTYVLAGQAIVAQGSAETNAAGTHAGDKRFRIAFNTTVKIRNRRNL